MLREAHRHLAREAPSMLHLGWACLVAAVLFGVLVALDPVQVGGESRWLKPWRFALSLGVYAWTIGFLLADLRLPRAWRLTVVGVTLAMILVEQGLITLQAARGVASHFNETSALDTAIYRAMGVAITVNALLVATLLPLGFAHPRPDVPHLRRWGWRLGIAVFLLGCAEAAAMIVHHAHAVGATDPAAPAIPLLGWRLDGGDLRVAHFIGIHGLQAMPLVALAIERGWPRRHPGHGAALLGLATLLYAAAGVLVFVAALEGRPFWRFVT